VIARHLRVLCCGINPGLYTAAVGHRFARPGNRFWPVLHLAGFTERILQPHEERELLRRGFGLTNVAPRATATAGELSATELAEGARRLTAKVQRYRPQWVAVLGVGAYRIAFARPRAVPGPQRETIGDTRIWVLPNPSGLNAHYQRAELVRMFRELRLEAERQARDSVRPEQTRGASRDADIAQALPPSSIIPCDG
jgi:TDG/mug DNA glycosylase family protein